jgi:hypothetical protein
MLETGPLCNKFVKISHRLPIEKSRPSLDKQAVSVYFTQFTSPSLDGIYGLRGTAGIHVPVAGQRSQIQRNTEP